MAKSLQITRSGGPEVFEMRDTPDLPLSRDSVQIRVTACGVNFADLMMRMGSYPEAPKPPFTPGYEIAGVVEEVGSAVLGFSKGQRVLAGTRFGGYTNRITLPAAQVRKTPEGLSDVEAAAIPVNFLTAWVALQDMARVRKGDRVLVQSAAGGVGLAAVQIAAHAGAHVTGLVGSLAKAEAVKAMGASEVLTNEQWETGRDEDFGGYTTILDSTGGSSVKRSFNRLASSGRVINFGAAKLIGGEKRSILKTLNFLKETAIFTPFKLMMNNKGIFGLNMLQLYDPQTQASPNVMSIALDRVLAEFAAGNLKVTIGKTFPLEEGGKAHTYLQSRANIGKVVLVPKES